MDRLPFTLKCFRDEDPPPPITLDGDIVRSADALILTYRLRGPLHTLTIPTPAEPPQRKHELWKSTCFELFLAPRGQTRYWEFNLSAGGHWNVYRFSDYRSGMSEESAFRSLPFTLGYADDKSGLDLHLAVDLSVLTLAGTALDIGITAVVADAKQKPSYWALTHPSTRPDFHHRDGFLL